MWDMRSPFCIRVPTTVRCTSVERRSGVARLSACCLTMRGARRSHNTIAERPIGTRNQRQRLSVRRHGTVRPAARPGLGAPSPKDSVEVDQRRGGPVTRRRRGRETPPRGSELLAGLPDARHRSLAGASPRARQDRGRVLDHLRRLTKAQAAKGDLPSAPPACSFPCGGAGVATPAGLSASTPRLRHFDEVVQRGFSAPCIRGRIVRWTTRIPPSGFRTASSSRSSART